MIVKKYWNKVLVGTFVQHITHIRPHDTLHRCRNVMSYCRVVKMTDNASDVL